MPKALKKCDYSGTIGTSRRETVDGVSTAKMIKKLGPPSCTAERDETDSKTTMEWIVPMGGSKLTVYDYRGSKWSIGGFAKDQKKAKKLKEYLEK